MMIDDDKIVKQIIITIYFTMTTMMKEKERGKRGKRKGKGEEE